MRFMIALCALIFLAGPIAAEDLEELRKSILQEALGTYIPSPEQRKSFAHWIGAECSSLLDKTPSLSPREKDWLEKEEEEGRFLDSHRSLENSKNFIRTTANKCKFCALQIEESNSEKKEMASWALMVSTLLEQDWQWHIDNAREDGGVTALTEDESAITGLFQMMGIRFLNNIVIPYLVMNAVSEN